MSWCEVSWKAGGSVSAQCLYYSVGCSGGFGACELNNCCTSEKHLFRSLRKHVVQQCYHVSDLALVT